ncbi:MAG TPA: alpha-amylase family protein [Chloroflexota bacterium]|nr:alpha-amylase family protein [Chloroflexota bacterium]
MTGPGDGPGPGDVTAPGATETPRSKQKVQIPYGAVYFRKSNPPPEDWARDYRTAAEDGMNVFRHWFLWSAIEVRPGEFDWADYDRQLDLAAAHGIKTIVAEMLTAAPEWAWREYAHARYQDATSRPARSQISGSCATGGFPGLCLDHEDVRRLAERFLTTLATRYRHHAGLMGYDVWNECNIPRTYCYCPATIGRFRDWLQAKYGTPAEVGRAWQRHSYAVWEDVDAPRAPGPYPEALDWLRFRLDNAYRLLRWRVETLRRIDPQHVIAAHGIASTLSDMAPAACDEWRAAAEVDVWGFTWVASRKGSEPWKQWHAVDLVRAGSRSAAARGQGGQSQGAGGEGATGAQGGPGKPFWHAEAQAGPLWMQPQVTGRRREDGRIAEPQDVRLWNMISFAGGATGILYPRWRPLLDGPLFGAFGAYAMDGSRTARSQMAAAVARWANDPQQASLWQARPVTGEVGIVVVPESQLFCYAQQGSTDFYAQCARGAYQGFLENGIQADWVHIDDVSHPAPLDRYRCVYLPFPVHLSADTATGLRRWVAGGGTLIAEGCPAYWGDRGRVGTLQPNLGLHELFGAREADVEFVPDLLGELELEWQGETVPGGIFRQSYEPAGGTASGWYTGRAAGPGAGQVAVVEHRFGHGRTLLCGTFPGYGHYHRPSAGSRRYFASLVAWAGVTPHVRILAEDADDAAQTTLDGEWRGVTVRRHRGEGGTFLWALNPARTAKTVTLQLGDGTPSGTAVPLWPAAAPAVAIEDGRLRLRVEERDSVVLRLPHPP